MVGDIVFQVSYSEGPGFASVTLVYCKVDADGLGIQQLPGYSCDFCHEADAAGLFP